MIKLIREVYLYDFIKTFKESNKKDYFTDEELKFIYDDMSDDEASFEIASYKPCKIDTDFICLIYKAYNSLEDLIKDKNLDIKSICERNGIDDIDNIDDIDDIIGEFTRGKQFENGRIVIVDF